MKQATLSLRQLIAGATPGPWEVQPHPADRTVLIYGPKPACRLVAELSPQVRFGQMQVEANAQLIARMASPEVALKVLDCLEWAERSSPPQSGLRVSCHHALQLLNALTLVRPTK